MIGIASPGAKIEKRRTIRGFRLEVAASLMLACMAPAVASIHAGDQLSVHVYNHPELSSDTVKVDSHGTISMPVVGTVVVAGLEPSAVSRILQIKLAPYLHYPAVDVRSTSESTVIFVAGGPGGVLPYAAGETLATALSDVEKGLQPSQLATNVASTNFTDLLDRSRIDISRVVVIRDDKTLGTFDMICERAGIQARRFIPTTPFRLLTNPWASSFSAMLRFPVKPISGPTSR
jgi:protein involved in polysaccharide export with SLBB domain